MDPKNAFRYAWQPYVVALAIIAAAAALRLWPLQALGVRLTWLTFYPAVVVAALYGGLSAGLLGTVLSCLAVLFVLPVFVDQPFIRDSVDWLGVAVFFITCTMISGVAEAMRRARAREKQAEAVRDRFFTLSLDMLCIARSDGYFKRLNPAFMETLGWTVEEMLARPFLDFVHPDDRAATLREVEKQVVAGEKVLNFVNRYQHKDGSWRWLSWKSAPAPDGLMYAVARDITELKSMEEVLRVSEARYRTLFDSIDEGYCIIEVIFDEREKPVDYRFLEINSAFEKQTGLIGAQGQRMRELAPGHEEYWFEIYGRIALGGEPVRFQNRAEQLRRWYDVYAFRYGEPKNRQVAILFNDITERKQAEEEIRKINVSMEAANKELEAFSYSVSHDLRAPLRHIDGFSQILLEDCSDKLDQEGRKHLQQVRQASQQMAQLIDDMLNLSRVTRAEMRRQTVDLSRMAETVTEALKKTQPDREVGFAIEEGLVAEGDERLLRVALDNLLGNAWKYTEKRPRARIEFGRTTQDGKAAYFVRDNGAGFDMAYAHKLFGVFQRLHSVSEFPGTGIGLATVQRIVHRHGGQVWAEGAVDRGATFYFTL